MQVFLNAAAECLEAASPEDAWDAVVKAEPAPARLRPAPSLEAIAQALGDFADLKSRFLAGHSSGVAKLAEDAGRQIGLPSEQVARLRVAGLLHDIGRVGVSTGIWDKPGPLTRTEWEDVRLHPYHVERILSRSPGLRDIARVAAHHHERLGGTGYPAGLPSQSLGMPARVLAAADVYHALREDRPHRPARSRSEAAVTLRDMSAPGGALDPNVCSAVLAAAGDAAPRRPRYPAGLTEREMEVLQLLARGRTEREIADRLIISAATAHTHILHIYDKAGVSTRAGVTLFALENELLRSEQPPE